MLYVVTVHLFCLHDDPVFFGFVSVLCIVVFQVKGRIFSYLMGLSRRPLTVFGIFFSIVTSLILSTVCISTVLYCNAVKKSRINPESNYIKVVRRVKWDSAGGPFSSCKGWLAVVCKRVLKHFKSFLKSSFYSVFMVSLLSITWNSIQIQICFYWSLIGKFWKNWFLYYHELNSSVVELSPSVFLKR